jgi:hypothetical protein
MHSACARRSRGLVPLGRQADSMFVISWHGGIMGSVTLGRQTEFTVVMLVLGAFELEGECKGRLMDGVRYASPPSVCRAASAAS